MSCLQYVIDREHFVIFVGKPRKCSIFFERIVLHYFPRYVDNIYFLCREINLLSDDNNIVVMGRLFFVLSWSTFKK